VQELIKKYYETKLLDKKIEKKKHIIWQNDSQGSYTKERFQKDSLETQE